MMKRNEIIFAADCSQPIIDALVDVYQKATYEGGQHDLINCRICHREQNYHTGKMVHKEDCPVGILDDLLSRFYPNPQP